MPIAHSSKYFKQEQQQQPQQYTALCLVQDISSSPPSYREVVEDTGPCSRDQDRPEHRTEQDRTCYSSCWMR